MFLLTKCVEICCCNGIEWIREALLFFWNNVAAKCVLSIKDQRKLR
jgi:hypothetical protein